MNRLDTIVTLGMMVLGFMVTFAVMRTPRPPPGPISLGTRVVNSEAAAAPGAVPAAAPHEEGPLVAAPPAGPRPAPTAAIDVPPADAGGPPLPVMLAVSAHPGQRQRVGDGETDPDTSAVARQVDVINTSSDALTVTVMAVDPPSRATSLAQVLVPPNGQAHVGTESGLKLDPGAAITLRSSGYQEMTTTVP